MPLQETVKTIVPRCWRWLGNCCLRPQATVLKSSPTPRVNSFDCSLNRHEITVYYLIMVFFRRNWSYLPTRGPPEPVSLIWLFMHCLSISKLVISQHQQKHSDDTISHDPLVKMIKKASTFLLFFKVIKNVILKNHSHNLTFKIYEQ